MWHDEPANRPGQDPNGYLPANQWEVQFRLQIAHYSELVERYPKVKCFATQLAKYQDWLDSLLADKANLPETKRLPF